MTSEIKNTGHEGDEELRYTAKYIKMTPGAISFSSPADDKRMKEAFKDTSFAKRIVCILLSNDSLKITKVLTEKRARANFIDGDSICLDVHKEDDSERKWDVEEFLANDSADAPLRPRIHSSFMDVGNHENEGIGIDELPELYVIIPSDHDTFGQGKTRYTCIRANVKTGEPFNDGPISCTST